MAHIGDSSILGPGRETTASSQTVFLNGLVTELLSRARTDKWLSSFKFEGRTAGATLHTAPFIVAVV